MTTPQIILELYVPIYFYILITLIFIQFLVWIGLGSKQINAAVLLTSSRTWFTKINVFLFIVSLIGCPPTLGFFSKILILHILGSTHNILLILLVLITNVFLMVMYLQQLRLTQVLRKKSVLTIRYAGNSKQAYLILLFQYINVTAIWITPIILDLLGSNIF